MTPSWSIFDCRQLVSFQLPLTPRSIPGVTFARLKRIRSPRPVY